MNKKYKIIYAHGEHNQNTLKILEDIVNSCMARGYEPVGNPQKFDNGYFQAVYNKNIRDTNYRHLLEEVTNIDFSRCNQHLEIDDDSF